MMLTRPLSTTALRRDMLSDLDKQLNPREIIEAKRKAYEEKYGDKLKRKIAKWVLNYIPAWEIVDS
jgi:hypothetical protein